MFESRTFQIEQVGATLVVVPMGSVGSLADEDIKPELRLLLAHLDDPAIVHAVIDLEHVAYFGTSMLEVMHAVWRRLRDRGGKLAICGASDVGREVLRISRFDTLWEIHETRRQAIDAVASET